MSELLKVGDKFTDSIGCIVNVLAVTSERLIYEHNGEENGWTILGFLKQFKPYQEPVPVKRIVAHVASDGCICLSFDGDVFCTRNDLLLERIELSPEMFWGAK